MDVNVDKRKSETTYVVFAMNSGVKRKEQKIIDLSLLEV
jgi:hypothetical protein